MADPAGTETVEKAKKRRKDTPTQPEREHPAIEVSPKSPCGAISLGRRFSYQRNAKSGPRDEETQKFAGTLGTLGYVFTGLWDVSGL